MRRAVLAIGLVWIGCASPLASAAPDAGAQGPLDEARACFARRLERAQLDRAIALLEGESGLDARLLDARARLFRARAFELRHRPWQRREGLADLDAARALARVQAKDGAVPALVLLAEASWQRARWSDAALAARLLREVVALAERAAALDPGFDHGAPHRLWGMALVALPGGDLVRARLELEEAIRLAPLSVENRVNEAAGYAVKAQDRALFRALLDSALGIDPKALPEVEPEQRLARARALALRWRERELFQGAP